MKKLNNTYTEVFNLLTEQAKHNPNSSDQKKSTTSSETPYEFIHIVNELIKLKLNIELCGTWLWVTGNTCPVKDKLVILGCKWSKNKKAWYYTNDVFVNSKYHKVQSITHIRMKYGSENLHKSTSEPKALHG